MMNSKTNTEIRAHRGTRPMAVHVDTDGYWWLCDSNIENQENLEQQGCWRYDLMAFDRND